MITYVDTSPTIEPRNGGFLLTFRSGDAENQFFLSLHAMSALCGKGALRIKEAQASAAAFEPTPLKRTRRRPKC